MIALWIGLYFGCGLVVGFIAVRDAASQVPTPRDPIETLLIGGMLVVAAIAWPALVVLFGIGSVVARISDWMDWR